MNLQEFLEYLGQHRSTKKWAEVFGEVVDQRDRPNVVALRTRMRMR